MNDQTPPNKDRDYELPIVWHDAVEFDMAPAASREGGTGRTPSARGPAAQEKFKNADKASPSENEIATPSDIPLALPRISQRSQ